MPDNGNTLVSFTFKVRGLDEAGQRALLEKMRAMVAEVPAEFKKEFAWLLGGQEGQLDEARVKP